MSNYLISNIYLDESVDISRTPEIEYEYKTAIADLLQENSFKLTSNDISGPYILNLRKADNRILIDIESSEENNIDKKEKVVLPVTPFRSIVRDYFFICESYYQAVKQNRPSQIETVDMAKRSLHNEGATLLTDLLLPEIEVDFDTARRLFTLICVLHVR